MHLLQKLIAAFCLILIMGYINKASEEEVTSANISIPSYKVQTTFIDQEILDRFKLKPQMAQLLEKAVFHQMLGINMFFEENYALALKHFTIANNYAPNNPSILIRLSETYTQLNQPELSATYKIDAIKQAPELSFLNEESND